MLIITLKITRCFQSTANYVSTFLCMLSALLFSPQVNSFMYHSSRPFPVWLRIIQIKCGSCPNNSQSQSTPHQTTSLATQSTGPVRIITLNNLKISHSFPNQLEICRDFSCNRISHFL